MAIGDDIRSAREAKGLSQRELAKRIGISQAAIDKIESGLTRQSKHLPEIRRQLGLEEQGREAPVVGYVGAGSEAHYYGEGQGPFDEVQAPAGSTAQTVAVEIRGNSMGELLNGWLIFYDEVRSPVTDDLVGQVCVVGLPDERVLVKKLQRSRTPGLYHLFSQNGTPLTDVTVVWAARVNDIRPR